MPPPKLTNSPRLQELVQSGNLYLSVQDLIALMLENNLDIAVRRYGPFLAREVQRRADFRRFACLSGTLPSEAAHA